MRLDARDFLVIIGMVMLMTGIWFYDWRLALVVIGALLILLGLIGAWIHGSK